MRVKRSKERKKERREEEGREREWLTETSELALIYVS